MATDNNDTTVHVSTASVSIDQSMINQVSSARGLSFHDITYEVTQRRFIKKLPNKVILKSVSGVMIPGLNAIMGPTGSGKTTLLDILAGRKGKSGISGQVLINGDAQPDNFKCISGYVVQDDVIMGTLTVKENLFFSAALRLPSSIPWSEKKERVNKVIKQLGLTNCADTKVGNTFIRGVSGGERKRTNIGMELIIEPQFLFLDEPTTGLDAFTAVAVVKLLRNICVDDNRVVIMSIHQPRYAIYKLFDTLTLLSQGDLVFYGPNHLALNHFTRIGFECEAHNNPADFMLDVINLCEEKSPDVEEGEGEETNNLRARYAASHLGQSNGKRTQELLQQYKSKQETKTNTSYKYATNILWQILVMITRSTVNILRNPRLSMLQLIVMVVFGLIIGILFFQLDNGPNGFQDRLGAIFFMVMNQVFININAVELFISQKPLFIHENAGGFYRVSVYFISKYTCDIIPLRVIPLIVYSLIAYFMIGFQTDVAKFFIFFFTLFLTSLGASSIAFFFSGLVNATSIAILLIAMSFIIQMLFSGFLIALDSLPTWIGWLQYLSIFRYAIEALSVNEIDGLVFSDVVERNGTRFEVMREGSALLEVRGFDPDWLFYDWIGIAMYSVIFTTLAYIALRLIKKEK